MIMNAIGDEIVNVAIEGPEARQCKDLGLLPETPGFIEYLWTILESG